MRKYEIYQKQLSADLGEVFIGVERKYFIQSKSHYDEPIFKLEYYKIK